ncbi:hypothetical protein K3495_g243 [Podosphaera aphanis]|nr:hypothetical protein K3495_g243 [Podosphaera aphanis]
MTKKNRDANAQWIEITKLKDDSNGSVDELLEKFSTLPFDPTKMSITEYHRQLTGIRNSLPDTSSALIK